MTPTDPTPVPYRPIPSFGGSIAERCARTPCAGKVLAKIHAEKMAALPKTEPVMRRPGGTYRKSY